jgi:thiamine-monophosphate kinase
VGASAAGLRRYRELAAGAGKAANDASLLRAHARPAADLAAGRAARQAGAHAMIDVSDGLIADLGHLAAASGVAVVVDRVPVAAGATREEALRGGEDFALAFCAPDETAVSEAFAGLPAPIRIGGCIGGAPGVTVEGQPVDVGTGGWEHRW